MYDVIAVGRELDLPDPADRFLDRELSWLAFNERVLDLASDPEVPLLERVRFLSIFASNLDEFFMVRVAGLKRRINTGLAVPTVTGRMPLQVMHAISIRAHELMTRHAELLKNVIGPQLDAESISKVSMDELTDTVRGMQVARYQGSEDPRVFTAESTGRVHMGRTVVHAQLALPSHRG